MTESVCNNCNADSDCDSGSGSGSGIRCLHCKASVVPRDRQDDSLHHLLVILSPADFSEASGYSRWNA